MEKIRFYRNSPVADDGRALYEGALYSGEKHAFVYPASEVDAEIERLTDQLKSQNDEAKRLEAELVWHKTVVEAAKSMMRACEDVWVEGFHKGAVDQFYVANHMLDAALSALVPDEEKEKTSE
jgi:hypothetical protein